jgi:hypothetical protein
MFRHRNAILRESTETKELQSNTSVQVLIALIGIIKVHFLYFKVYFDILKYIPLF